MTISEILTLIKRDTPIQRESWHDEMYIVPTDSIDCCIVGGIGKEAPRWNPKREDLIADDWVIRT